MSPEIVIWLGRHLPGHVRLGVDASASDVFTLVLAVDNGRSVRGYVSRDATTWEVYNAWNGLYWEAELAELADSLLIEC